MPTARTQIRHAARILAHGGVALYPTEGVWGLGCDPLNAHAVQRILDLKQRDVDKGLVLVADTAAAFRHYLAVPELVDRLATQATDVPTTWVVPAAPDVPDWITGGRDTLAARVTRHPVAAGLSAALGAPVVSTSANPSGRPAPTRRFGVDRWILRGVDVRLGGQTGGLRGATPIIDLRTGQYLRGA